MELRRLENMMEQFVFAEIHRALSNDGLCGCDDCALDVSALALNNLSAKYVTSHAGELFNRAESSRSEDRVAVIAEIQRAINKVRHRLPHD